MQRVSMSTLVAIAGGTFVSGSFFLYVAHKRVQWRVRGLRHYMESLEIVAEHPHAKDALGPPIEIGNVDLADRKHNYVDKTTSKLRIPVKGKLDSGWMEVRAVRKEPKEGNKQHDADKDFVTDRVRLELQQGTFTIYDAKLWPKDAPAD